MRQPPKSLTPSPPIEPSEEDFGAVERHYADEPPGKKYQLAQIVAITRLANVRFARRPGSTSPSLRSRGTHRRWPVHRRRAILATFALVVLVAPRDVHACWDGWVASAPRVTVAHAKREGGSSWSTGRARALATMLARLRVVTPHDQELSVTPWGDVTFCPLDTSADGWWTCTTDESAWGNDDPNTLVEVVAEMAHGDGATLARAKAASANAYTVQVFAARSRARADAEATRVDNLRDPPESFYVHGGFPATNPEGHVVPGPNGLHRVLVGAYLGLPEARHAATKLSRALGRRVVVKPLDSV